MVFSWNFGFGKMKGVVYFFTSSCMSKKAVADVIQFEFKSMVVEPGDNATDALPVGIYSNAAVGRTSGG